MPTYEYRCPAGHEFEVFQRMSEPPEAPCPECGENASRQLSGGAGFLFKGDGFYITDYRSKEYKEAAKAEESPATSKEGSDSKSDSSVGKDDAGSTPSSAPSGGSGAESSGSSAD